MIDAARDYAEENEIMFLATFKASDEHTLTAVTGCSNCIMSMIASGIEVVAKRTERTPLQVAVDMAQWFSEMEQEGEEES